MARLPRLFGCGCACVVLSFLFCFVFGVYISFAFLPTHSNPLEGTVVDRAVHTHIGSSLKSKILSWIPDKEDDSLAAKSPIAAVGTSGLVMCKLDFKSYSEKPYNYPMFKDLVTLSGCEDNKQSVAIAEVKKDIIRSAGTPQGRVVYPTAFVFHESRVGSTLVANMLASDADNMVYSEADVPSSLFNYDNKVRRFRETLMLLGRSATHKRLFFKFQSVKTLNIHVALEAFPDVPWIFIYRKPVQVMMSHVDPRSVLPAGTAPCLRTRGSRRTHRALQPHLRDGEAASDAAYCAAHLSTLCDAALEAFEKYGTYSSQAIADIEREDISSIKFKLSRDATPVNMSAPRGIAVDYDSLPGILPRTLSSLTGVALSAHWLQRIREVSTEYSKGRAWYYPKAGFFKGDSSDKDSHATDEIHRWADALLGPSYAALTKIALRSYSAHHKPAGKGSDQVALVSVGHPTYNHMPAGDALGEGPLVDWSAVKPIPSAEEERYYVSADADWSFTADSNFVTKKFNPFSSVHNSSSFERFECPDKPSPDYPKGYPMKNVLDNWNVDDTDIPAKHYDSFCRFDFQTEMNKIVTYKKKEVPFIIYNMPALLEAKRRWSDIDYLNDRLGPYFPYPVDTSPNNHFMYAKGHSLLEDAELLFNGPTGKRLLTFEQWLSAAIDGHALSTAERTHSYFRVDSSSDEHWLFDELPYFKPHSELFDTRDKGIHCRFGMKGIIAECHYDGGENYASSVGGLRRWIMLHPDQCEDLYLIKQPSVSARHSEVDWSHPDYEKYPLFREAQANEVILQGGEILYVPSFWFHFIVSLNVNFQCNSRSTTKLKRNHIIQQCIATDDAKTHLRSVEGRFK